MVHQVHIPCPPLNQFIESLWYYEAPTPCHAVDRMMPSGELGVILNLRDDRLTVSGEIFRGALVAGAATKPFLLETAQQTLSMGIVFRPGGAFSFLGPPVSKMRDCSVGLDELWGLDSIELRERLVLAETVSAKFSALESFLRRRMARTRESHPAVKYALEQFGTPWPRAISEVTACIGLSKARFARLFQEQTGLTPKLFCRLQRFQRSVRRLHSASCIDLPEVALDLGYYDQPHFIHEFHEFSGVTPTAYLRARGQHANHVPIPDAG
jgi:AraC-like DNA-binding protein